MSTVRRVEVFAVSHPIDPPQGVSIGLATAHAYVLVRLEDADGRVGWGETYLLPGMAEMVRDQAALAVGTDPTALRRHRPALASTYAQSAVSIALDDLRGRQLGCPVHVLHGGPLRDSVVAYAASQGYVDGVDPEDAWPAEVAGYAQAGFSVVKLRIGRYPIERERAALAALPRSVRLLVDGNGAYTPAGAVRMGRELESLDVGWFEEPLPQRGYRGYGRLARTLDIAVAGGEILETPEEALRLLSAEGVDILQPEPVICGGIDGALRIAEIAAAHGIPVVPHTSGGALGIAAALQVLACLPDPSGSPSTDAPLLEFGTGENPWRTDLLTVPLVLEAGRVAVPSGPGLGVEVNEPFVRASAQQTLNGP